MASHRRDNDQPMFTTKTPHFSTVIRPETIQDGKLEIPENFVRKFGKRLPRTVQLKAPSGETWHVDLTKCDQKVWLQQGWQEFADHFSLETTHFVVFRFVGNASFHVFIFDRTATEIEYPHSNSEEEEEEEESLECKKRKEKSGEPCFQPPKRMKADSVRNEAGTSSKSKVLASVRKGSSGVTDLRSPQIEAPRRRVRGMTADEIDTALEKAASGFRTKYPSFMLLIQPMHVRRFRMSIPMGFARKHLMKIPNGTMIQCVWNGQKWPAKYYCLYDTKYPQPQLRGGYMVAFSKHAALQVGDVCIFELTKMSPEVMLKVSIYPIDANAARPAAGRGRNRVLFNNEKQKQPLDFQISVEKLGEEAEDDVIEILEETPPCKKMRERSPFQCHRPPKNKKTNMTNKSENILEAKSNLAPRFRSYGNKAKEIKVEKLKGSACSSSSKHGDGKGMGYGLECPEQAVILSFKQLSEEEKAKTLLIAKSFKSRNPFFLAIIQPAHTKYYMFIPNTFAKKFFTKIPGGKATLFLSNGKSWPVKYVRRACRQNPKAQFWAGWKKFALDNRLAVGDICVFELLQGAKMTLKVVMYRVADAAKAASPGRNRVLFNNEKQKQCLDFQNSMDKLGEEAEDDVIEILEETPPCKKMRERSPFQCHRPPKNKKTNMTYKTENILEAKSVAPRFRSYGNKAKEIKVERLKGRASSSSSKHGDGLEACKRTGSSMGNGLECPEQASILRFRKLSAEEKAKTLRIANSFKTKNPFFLAIIQPSHTIFMSIPSNFAKKFLTKTPIGKATLCLPNGKSWPVKYKCRPCHDDNSRAYFSTDGWSKFALDNLLVPGDICVFELLHQGAKITLQVVIHRIADVAKGFPKRNSFMSLKAPDAAAIRSFASDSPFFTKTIMPSFLNRHGRMMIPFEFIKKHFKPDTKNVILQVADKLWSMKLAVYKERRKGKYWLTYARLTSGWMKFARDNSLKVGDVCVFKLITSSNDAMLNVSILRREC